MTSVQTVSLEGKTITETMSGSTDVHFGQRVFLVGTVGYPTIVSSTELVSIWNATLGRNGLNISQKFDKCFDPASKYLFKVNIQETKTKSIGAILASCYFSLLPALKTYCNIREYNSAITHLFKVNNRNTRKMQEICSKLSIKNMVFLRLTLNIFHVFSSVSIADFEQANFSWKGLFTTLSKNYFWEYSDHNLQLFFCEKAQS